MNYSETDLSTFWECVRKNGPKEFPDCWEWTLRMDSGRVAPFVVETPEGKKRLQPAFVSWEIHHGTLPDKTKVRLDCKNPFCVRPDHLYVPPSITHAAEQAALKEEAEGESSATHVTQHTAPTRGYVPIHVTSFWRKDA